MSRSTSRQRRARTASSGSGRMKSKSIGHYLLGKTLGEGTFGKVRLGTHIMTGEKVAIKILEKSRIVEPADVERVSREIGILKRVRHKNVIQLYEVIDTQRQIFLIMEYSDGGELFDYIVAHTRVKEPDACRFFHEIVDGVDYLHSREVIHRDLKPENLLMQRHKDRWRVKVIDFGLSNTCDGGRLLKTACGSPCYASPEMIAGHKYVGSLADIWSLGVILFALVCGYLPFEDASTGKLYQKILAGDYQAPKFISPAARDLIRRILITDPKKRYTITDIRRHPWYRQVVVPPSPQKTVPTQVSELDPAVLRRVQDLGMDPNAVQDSISRGAHDHATTTYFLVAGRMRRETATGAISRAISAGPASAGPSSSAAAAGQAGSASARSRGSSSGGSRQRGGVPVHSGASSARSSGASSRSRSTSRGRPGSRGYAPRSARHSSQQPRSRGRSAGRRPPSSARSSSQQHRSGSRSRSRQQPHSARGRAPPPMVQVAPVHKAMYATAGAAPAGQQQQPPQQQPPQQQPPQQQQQGAVQGSQQVAAGGGVITHTNARALFTSSRSPHAAAAGKQQPPPRRKSDAPRSPQVAAAQPQQGVQAGMAGLSLAGAAPVPEVTPSRPVQPSPPARRPGRPNSASAVGRPGRQVVSRHKARHTQQQQQQQQQAAAAVPVNPVTLGNSGRPSVPPMVAASDDLAQQQAAAAAGGAWATMVAPPQLHGGTGGTGSTPPAHRQPHHQHPATGAQAMLAGVPLHSAAGAGQPPSAAPGTAAASSAAPHHRHHRPSSRNAGSRRPPGTAGGSSRGRPYASGRRMSATGSSSARGQAQHRQHPHSARGAGPRNPYAAAAAAHHGTYGRPRPSSRSRSARPKSRSTSSGHRRSTSSSGAGSRQPASARPVAYSAHIRKMQVPVPATSASAREKGSSSSGQQQEGRAGAVVGSGGTVVSSTSSQPPESLMQQLQHVLQANQVTYQQTGAYTLRCKRMNMTFEFEVTKTTVDSLHVVRSRPVRADAVVYNDVVRRLMAQMRL